MHWFMIGLLMVVMLCVFTLTRNVRIMPKLPMISMDWLGCALWSLTLLEAIWIFTYGEYYNWFDGNVFRVVCLTFVVTLCLCLSRMLRIRHPFISPKAFTYKGLLPVLALFAVCELMSAGSKSLQNVFLSSVLGYGSMTMTRFSVVEYVGVVTGCLFVMFWIKVLKLNYTRLLTLGFGAMLCYHLIMYFVISPDTAIQMFYLPTALRTFGYAVFFAVLTIYLEERMPFPHFFMGLTICGFIRNGLVESIASAAYSHSLRYYVADYAGHFVSNLSDATGSHIQGLSVRMSSLSPMMSGIKTLFGWTCLFGCAALLLFLLYDVEPVRRTFKKMLSWKVVGRKLRIKLVAR